MRLNPKSRLMMTTDLPIIGQVYDGGAMGSAPNLYYLTHPVTVGGAEVEGQPGVLTVDTSRTIPMYVMGDQAPQVGDYLIGHFGDTRWVAELFKPASSGYPVVPDAGCACGGAPSVLELAWTVTPGAPGCGATSYYGLPATDTLTVQYTIPPGTSIQQGPWWVGAARFNFADAAGAYYQWLCDGTKNWQLAVVSPNSFIATYTIIATTSTTNPPRPTVACDPFSIVFPNNYTNSFGSGHQPSTCTLTVKEAGT